MPHAHRTAPLLTRFSQDPADFNDKNIDVIVFAVAIVALSKVLAAFPTDLLENKLVVDVLSVKTFPKQELLKMLPGGTDLLCTHPMFGPESGKHSWDALPLVFETVQLSETADSRWRCATFLGFFEEAGCTMVRTRSHLNVAERASTVGVQRACMLFARTSSVCVRLKRVCTLTLFLFLSLLFMYTTYLLSRSK